ncbi:hypothetical protein OUZ56_009400 [Daphnia magna]|uniref:Uncharacterized protein n=1 Tax=Daphnia magna TaxID=35525 RepID=A0ABR0AG14_9CRUS|nr:hypothetical protein OUZ56_009400 [Daphnia magna]
MAADLTDRTEEPHRNRSSIFRVDQIGLPDLGQSGPSPRYALSKLEKGWASERKKAYRGLVN